MDGNHLRFVLPTTIAPKYIPEVSSSTPSKMGDEEEEEEELQSDRNASARVAVPKALTYSTESHYKLKIGMELEMPSPIVDINSPTHDIEIIQSFYSQQHKPSKELGRGKGKGKAKAKDKEPQKMNTVGSTQATVVFKGKDSSEGLEMNQDLVLLVSCEAPHEPRAYVERCEVEQEPEKEKEKEQEKGKGKGKGKDGGEKDSQTQSCKYDHVAMLTFYPQFEVSDKILSEIIFLGTPLRAFPAQPSWHSLTHHLKWIGQVVCAVQP